MMVIHFQRNFPVCLLAGICVALFLYPNISFAMEENDDANLYEDSSDAESAGIKPSPIDVDETAVSDLSETSDSADIDTSDEMVLPDTNNDVKKALPASIRGFGVGIYFGVNYLPNAAVFANDDVHGAIIEHDEIDSPVFMESGIRLRDIPEKNDFGFDIGLGILTGPNASQGVILSGNLIYLLKKPHPKIVPYLKGGACLATFEWGGNGDFDSNWGAQFGAGAVMKFGRWGVEFESIYRYLTFSYNPTVYSTRLYDNVNLSGLSFRLSASMTF